MITIYKPELVGYTLSYYIKDQIPRGAATVLDCGNDWYKVTVPYTGIISQEAVYAYILQSTQANPLNVAMTTAVPRNSEI